MERLLRPSENMDLIALDMVKLRRVLSNFFGWCVKTGASPENPAAGLEKGSRIQRRPATMTATTFKDLLAKAKTQRRADVLAWLILGGLCGLRPFEALRVHWSAVQWETSELRIEPQVSKTKRARIVAIQPVTLVWLKLAYDLAGRPSGQVMPRNPLGATAGEAGGKRVMIYPGG
jgi:integrase